MDFQAVMSRLSAESRKQPFDLILVGGWALGAYGVARQTADIDFVCRDGDVGRVENVLAECGYQRVFRSDLFAKFRSDAVGLHDVDVLFVDGDTMRALLSEAKETAVGAAVFRVPAVLHLIAMKLHALKHNAPRRLGRDLSDIVALVEANRIDAGAESFRALC